LRGAALEKILFALPPAPQRQRDLVGLEQRLVIRIFVVAQRRYVGGDRAVGGFPVAADERERGVAAHHLAVMDIDHAAARTMHRMHLDFVKPLQHCRSGPQLACNLWSSPACHDGSPASQSEISKRSFDFNRMLRLPTRAMVPNTR
jgi:hypothetical protein